MQFKGFHKMLNKSCTQPTKNLNDLAYELQIIPTYPTNKKNVEVNRHKPSKTNN